MVGRSDKGEFNPTFKGTDWSRDFCEKQLALEFLCFPRPARPDRLNGRKEGIQSYDGFRLQDA